MWPLRFAEPLGVERSGARAEGLAAPASQRGDGVFGEGTPFFLVLSSLFYMLGSR